MLKIVVRKLLCNCFYIDPSTATFASAKELFSLQTTYVNLHDELIGNLDCSGSSAVDGTLERRLKCFNSFVGPYGRNKNMGLFYCFLVWEGKNTRWLSKRLPDEVARGSTSQDKAIPKFNQVVNPT